MIRSWRIALIAATILTPAAGHAQSRPSGQSLGQTKILQRELEAARAEIAAQRRQIEAQEARLAALEARMGSLV